MDPEFENGNGRPKCKIQTAAGPAAYFIQKGLIFPQSSQYIQLKSFVFHTINTCVHKAAFLAAF